MIVLFAHDGVWVRLGEELIGAQAILAAMAERADWLTVHVVSNIAIDIIDSDNVESTQYVTLYRHEGREEAAGPAPIVPPLGVLRHRDRLIRLDGLWKLKRKSSRAIMTNEARPARARERAAEGVQRLVCECPLSHFTAVTAAITSAAPTSWIGVST